MTPLLRWVFLASLLASAACSVVTLEDDACVRICRGPDPAGEKSAGVCEYRRHVLQSDGGRSAIQRLSRLCLTPCTDPVTTKPVFLEASEHCHSFRRFLARIRKCSCDSLRHELAQGQPSQGDSWIEELFGEYEKYGLNAENVEARAEAILERILRPTDMPRPVDKARLSLAGHLLAMRLMKGAEADAELDGPSIEESDGIENTVSAREDETKSKEGLPGSLDSRGSSEESVDWEMWCMAQCDNGQGGSACNCDIIP